MRKKLLLCFFLLFSLTTFQAFAQQKTVTGVVKDDKGEPIPGATIIVKGTSNGVSTDIEGKYSIQVAEGKTLIFQALQMVTQEIVVGSQTTLDVTMSDSKLLDELIVTGYREQVKEKITGSVATVQAADIEQVPFATFDQALQGQAPGLQINIGSGQPGAGAPNIQIRGAGSINGGTEPLFIMDGVPINANDFSALNPNDIASVNILKDASATSIYGSRAANGVIVITTKKGKKGKTRLTYRYQHGVSQRTLPTFEMMNTNQKVDFETTLYNDWGITKGTGGQIFASHALGNITTAERDAQLAALRNINTDWTDVIFQDGVLNSHELNASGGNDVSTYYVSAGYRDQDGIAERSNLKRYTLRFNNSNKIGKFLRLGLNSTIAYATQNRIESEDGVALANPFAYVYLANAYDRVYDPNGANGYALGPSGTNPKERLDLSSNNRADLKGLGNIFLEADIIKGLTAKLNAGIDWRTRTFDRWIHPESVAGGSTALPGQQGSLMKEMDQRVVYIVTSTLQYNKAFGKHYISAILGNEIVNRNFQGFEYTGYGLNSKLTSPASITTGSATFLPAIDGFNTDSRLLSYFFDAAYNFDGKYNLSFGFRRDGSSRFGPNVRFANFWSVGASWNIHEEAFMAGMKDIVESAKLRASYGTSGNQEDIGDFDYLGTFSTVSYDGISGIIPSAISNPNYQWEVSTQFNVGLDFRLLKGRVSGSIDYYNNLTSSLFIDSKLSQTSGFDELPRNVGKMRNSGLEIQLSFDPIRTKDFTWTIYGNISFNKNVIEDLFQEDEFEFGTSIVREGLPLGSHFVVGWAGVNPANGQPLYLDKNGSVTSTYSDANSLATWGTSNAPRFGGFTNRLTYKGLELSFFFNFVNGKTIFNNQTFFIENPNFAQFNQSTEMLKMWAKEGDITDIQSPAYQRQFTSKDLENASFLRLRNVSLAYTLPKNILEKIKMRSVRVYVQAQNLATFTRTTVFDPDVNNNINQFAYPTPRIYTMGIDVGF